MAVSTTRRGSGTRADRAGGSLVRGPLGVAALLLLAVLALGLLVVNLPGGTVIGDSTSNVQSTAVLPPITDDAALVQPIRASNDELAAVYVTFGTFGGASRCSLDVALHEASPSGEPGRLIAHQVWSCSVLPDSTPQLVLSFAPVAASKGQLFDVVVSRADHGKGAVGAPVVWAGKPVGDALPAVMSGNTQDLSAVVRAEYEPRATLAVQAHTLLDRMAQYGAGWAQPVAFLGILVIAAIAVVCLPLVARSTRWTVVAICVLALARGLVWSAVVPPLEAMDEPAHLANVQYFAEEGRFPGSTTNHGYFSQRLDQTVVAMHVSATSPGARPDFSPGAEQRTDSALRAVSPGGGGGGPASSYGPLYYAAAVPFYDAAGGDPLRQTTYPRLWSVTLGVVAAGLLVLVGRQLFPGRRAVQIPFAVAAVLQPMMGHQFAIVNNDAWVILCGIAALSAGLALAARRRATGLALLAGVIVGAALMAKPFGIATVVPLGVGWLIGKARHREWSARVLVREVGALVLGFVLTYGTWRLIGLRYGISSPAVPSATGVVPSVRGFLSAEFGHSFSAPITMWGSQLWGDFGWVRIPLPDPLPVVLLTVQLLLLGLLLVWALQLVVHRVARARRGARIRSVAGVEPSGGPTPAAGASVADERVLGSSATGLPVDARLAVAASMLVGTLGTLYAAGLVYYFGTGKNDLLQGRYGLMAIPALLAVAPLLAERWAGRAGRVVGTVLAAGTAVLCLGLTVLGLLITQEAFYG